MTSNNAGTFESLFENPTYVRQPSIFRPAAIERLETELAQVGEITSGNDYNEVRRRQNVDKLQSELTMKKSALTQTQPVYVPPSASILSFSNSLLKPEG
jgi:hypothetical protein